MTRPGSRLAVDVGGTFTDIALEGPDGITTTKTPTTPGDPAEAVITGIRLVLERAALPASEVATVIQGARVGVVTTQGFRDVLEIAYERRYDQYDIFVDKPDMLVPRERSGWQKISPATASKASRSACCTATPTPLTSGACSSSCRNACLTCGSRSPARCRRRSANTTGSAPLSPTPTSSR
jgi:hypothetical protein